MQLDMFGTTGESATRRVHVPSSAPTQPEVAAKAMTDMNEVEHTPPSVENPREETEVFGLRVYPITLKGEPRWSVQNPDNVGTNKVLGDTIHGTLDEAKAEAKAMRAAADRRAERMQEDVERQAQAQAKKEVNKGKSLTERRVDAFLDGPTKFHPNAGLGTGSRRESMQLAVDQDRLVTMVMVSDAAAKKKDQDTVANGSKRNLMAGLTNPNLPAMKPINEAAARLKLGKYEKPDYRVYDSHDDQGGFREISKIEFEYAKDLLLSLDTKGPVAEDEMCEIKERFVAIALELGVPSEKSELAGKQCFESMVRMSEKHHKETDRDLRKCGLPVPTRVPAEFALVEWLGSLPATTRDATIKNNIRPYIALYENDLSNVVTEGLFSGPVLSIANGAVVQKVNRAGDTVQHDVSKLSIPVKVGDVLDVQYQGGRGLVAVKGQSVGVGR